MALVHIGGTAAPTAGFEVPLEMLAACHLRVQSQCETLQRLVPHLATHGADRAAQEAAAAVVRYFDTAARHHHEDEEQDLFPALLGACLEPEAAAVRRLTDDLCADHRRLEGLWQALRQVLHTIGQGRRADLRAAEVTEFVETYARHITREDAELLPMAASVLDTTRLDQVGRAMRARRGV